MKRLLLGIVVAAAIGAAVPGSVFAFPPALVTCGDHIQSPGIYALSGNCGGAGILISASDVTLRLRNHTMYDMGSDTGITVANESNVRIEGPGKLNGFNIGISFDHVTGSHVELVKIVNSAGHGVALFDSSSNSLNWDVVIGSTFHGFTLNGSNDNKLEHDVSNGNGSNGIYLASSSDNHVAFDVLKRDFAAGIDVADIGNGPANGNTIRENVANDSNTGGGIALESGVSSNVVVHNRAHGNHFDLYDGNAACGSNTWAGNVFGSANLGCIH